MISFPQPKKRYCMLHQKINVIYQFSYLAFFSYYRKIFGGRMKQQASNQAAFGLFPKNAYFLSVGTNLSLSLLLSSMLLIQTYWTCRVRCGFKHYDGNRFSIHVQDRFSFQLSALEAPLTVPSPEQPK